MRKSFRWFRRLAQRQGQARSLRENPKAASAIRTHLNV